MSQESSFPKNRGAGTLNVAALCTSILILIVLDCVTTFVRPALKTVFADFAVTLPAPTTWLMHVPPEVFLRVYFWSAILLLLKELVIQSRSVRRVVNVAAALALCGFLAVTLIALLVPLVALIQRLSQPSRLENGKVRESQRSFTRTSPDRPGLVELSSGVPEYGPRVGLGLPE